MNNEPFPFKEGQRVEVWKGKKLLGRFTVPPGEWRFPPNKEISYRAVEDN